MGRSFGRPPQADSFRMTTVGTVRMLEKNTSWPST
jgi:hypothetical protein